eukprot:TRINITY_DN7718_c0_g2_i1.p1 TRINITY_DN7718_c0_g2~~TRINITY_DN7718_c0_g2_i1.p1  ORF type:complete len:117 (+),score=9.61 TRINITY_DN7718_c0_g2_i1:140-490(+)
MDLISLISSKTSSRWVSSSAINVESSALGNSSFMHTEGPFFSNSSSITTDLTSSLSTVMTKLSFSSVCIGAASSSLFSINFSLSSLFSSSLITNILCSYVRHSFSFCDTFYIFFIF